MRGVLTTTTHKLELRLDADDWDLFTHTMDCSSAVEALNKTIEDAVNAGKSRDEVRRAADAEMMRQAAYGAADSEPGHVLQDVLDAVFGAA